MTTRWVSWIMTPCRAGQCGVAHDHAVSTVYGATRAEVRQKKAAKLARGWRNKGPIERIR